MAKRNNDPLIIAMLEQSEMKMDKAKGKSTETPKNLSLRKRSKIY